MSAGPQKLRYRFEDWISMEHTDTKKHNWNSLCAKKLLLRAWAASCGPVSAVMMLGSLGEGSTHVSKPRSL